MNKTLQEYLKKSEVETIKDLSDEQVESFFVEGIAGIQMKTAAMVAKSAVKRAELKRNDVIGSMRKSMEMEVSFECVYIENESADGENLPEKYGWIVNPS